MFSPNAAALNHLVKAYWPLSWATAAFSLNFSSGAFCLGIYFIFLLIYFSINLSIYQTEI